ncbi:hypothetical protein OIU85_022109 [Salix viminalis]|uniref:Uncharacterized protein n=1 Tax=Salix viminalis TaxID=40686 RepID=A0A9Q0U693_SALVM|nr:hypothetical protein OIU85_022109 [Salix viminalis]
MAEHQVPRRRVPKPKIPKVSETNFDEDRKRLIGKAGLTIEASADEKKTEVAKQVQEKDRQLQLQNRKEWLSAKKQNFIGLSIETVSLVENESEFEIIDPRDRLATLEVEE